MSDPSHVLVPPPYIHNQLSEFPLINSWSIKLHAVNNSKGSFINPPSCKYKAWWYLITVIFYTPKSFTDFYGVQFFYYSLIALTVVVCSFNIYNSFASDDNAECRQPTAAEPPGIQMDCECIFGGYQLLINAAISQHAGRTILSPELTSKKSSSDKELIKDVKRWIWFGGSVSNWTNERYWRGAEACAVLLY